MLRDPAPVVGISALGPTGVTITIAPWVSVADFGPAQAELYLALAEEFRTKGIRLPLPELRLLSTS